LSVLSALPSLPTSAFLFFAAIIAGIINSVAGGGSFLTFPALLFAGVPAIPANATNTAAVWPGTVASAFAYRNELDGEARRILASLAAVCLIGSLLGAYILLHTPPATFVRLIPWLLLCATIIFAASGKITEWSRGRLRGKTRSMAWTIGGMALQLIISIYVGYFGAGAGILILALLALMGLENIHAMNGMKTILVSIANGVALAAFIWHGIVVWPEAILMLIGALIGGYGGAHLARRVKQVYVKRAVVVIGLAMSAYFFVRH
jgi:uncharacterized membrane protein YfcA